MEKKEYKWDELEIIRLEATDVITDSGGDGDGNDLGDM